MELYAYSQIRLNGKLYNSFSTLVLRTLSLLLLVPLKAL